MQKIRYFVLRWLYRIAMFFVIVTLIAILTDSGIAAWVKAVAVSLFLLLLTVPEHFPKVFCKVSRKEMTGIDFEQHCAKVLIQKGFRNVKVTPPSGDYGADLVACDKRGCKWVVQCKHYKGKVGNSAVQEAVAAKAHYGADKAAVMTNSQLTSKAKQLALENEVVLFELIDD